MHLTLTATGLQSKVPLFLVDVDESGRWTYESRAVEEATGTLTEGDQAQLKSLFDAVPFDQETLNNPVSADDSIMFRLEVRERQFHQIYTFSEAMNHLSWQFRDLVHFLRHNVATGGDPVGRIPNEVHDRPPAVQ